jgi:hypothetical protein
MRPWRKIGTVIIRLEPLSAAFRLERCRFEAGQVYGYGLVQRSNIKCTGWQDYPLPDLLGSALCDDVQNPLLVAKTHMAHAV